MEAYSAEPEQLWVFYPRAVVASMPEYHRIYTERSGRAGHRPAQVLAH